MKKIVFLLVFIFTASFFISCNKKSKAATKVKKENIKAAVKRDVQIKKGEAVASFDKKEYDFGTVNEGKKVQVTYNITNSGKTDLVITNAQGSCGCTVPSWPKAPIKPGETKPIKVTFNTAGKPNKQLKTVTLITNTEKGREILKLKGFVTPKSKSISSK